MTGVAESEAAGSRIERAVEEADEPSRKTGHDDAPNALHDPARRNVILAALAEISAKYLLDLDRGDRLETGKR